MLGVQLRGSHTIREDLSLFQLLNAHLDNVVDVLILLTEQVHRWVRTGITVSWVASLQCLEHVLVLGGGVLRLVVAYIAAKLVLRGKGLLLGQSSASLGGSWLDPTL